VNINIIGSASFTGYGQACRNIILELTKLGHSVAFFPKGKSEFNNKLEEDVINEAIRNSHFFDKKAPTLSIWHQHSLGERIGDGLHYVMPYFELDTLSAREQHHLKSADKVIATSHWAAEVLSKHLNKDILEFPVCPSGVNEDIFHPNYPKNDDGIYRFINIGKWEKRKGHDVIIKAFNLAFSPTDSVELVMMPYNPFIDPAAWLNIYKTNNLMKDKVTILPPVSTQYEVAKIINKCDCGIFMSRAEGWNLDLLEVMACGKPAITTCNTGMKDFVDNTNSLIVETTETEKAEDGRWFFGTGNWAAIGEKEIEQAAKYMRKAYDGKIAGNKDGLETAKRFSWKNSAEKLVEILEN
jgi:glycosyltransferase involved in cell wall biosynthesis